MYLGYTPSSEELLAWDDKQAFRAQQVADLVAGTQAKRGDVVKWLLYGTGGALLLGGVVLWIATRRSSNPCHRRR